MLEYTNKRVLLSICRKWKWTALAIHKPLTICSMFCILRALLHTQVQEWTSCCLLPLLVNNCGLSNWIYEWYKAKASTDIYCCGSSSYFPTHMFIAIITSHRMRCLPFIYGRRNITNTLFYSIYILLKAVVLAHFTSVNFGIHLAIRSCIAIGWKNDFLSSLKQHHCNLLEYKLWVPLLPLVWVTIITLEKHLLSEWLWVFLLN